MTSVKWRRRWAVDLWWSVVIAALAGCSPQPTTAPEPPLHATEVWFHAVPVVAAAIPGDSVAFSVDVFGDDSVLDVPATGPDAVVWSTSDSAIATVNQRGVLVPRSPGLVKLYATVGGYTGTFSFDVLPPVASAQIVVPPGPLVAPASFYIIPVLRSATGDSLATEFRKVRWASSDTLVAQVDSIDEQWNNTLYARVTLTGFGVDTITFTALDEHVSTQVVLNVPPLSFAVVKSQADYRPPQSCGLDLSGRAYCWGAGDSTARWTGYDRQTGSITVPVPRAMHTDLVFDSLAVGLNHACGLTHGGDVWCWGSNDVGQLGNGTYQPSPADPVLVAGDHHFVAIDAGISGTCGIDIAGAVWCWGSNAYDEFGIGRTVVATVPVAGVGGTLMRSLALTRSAQNGGASCGIRVDSVAVCWGINQQGEVGNGTAIADTLVPPQPVVSPEPFVWVVGGAHSCGLTTDGSAYCWGLRYGTTPQLVGGDEKFRTLHVDFGQTCGIALDGTVWCWGDQWTPMPTRIALPEPAAALDVSPTADCAVTTGHVAWCWSSTAPAPAKVPGQD